MDVNTISQVATTATSAAIDSASKFIPKPEYLIIGFALIILTVFIIKFFKNVIVNSIIGVVGLLISNIVFGLKLPFLLTLLVTAVFGPAGLGTMLILKFFGVV